MHAHGSGKCIQSGPPMPCKQCRKPFKSSVVVGGGKNRPIGMICPKCIKDNKRAKRNRKG